MCIRFALVLLLASSAACSSDENSFVASDIRSELPSGTMQSQPWTMVEAVVRVDSFDENMLSVSLYPADVEDCGIAAFVDGGEVLFSVPRMEGEYPFRLDFSADSQTATFVPSPGENIIATEGLIVIESLSATELTLGIVAEAGGNSVNGKFTSAICP